LRTRGYSHGGMLTAVRSCRRHSYIGLTVMLKASSARPSTGGAAANSSGDLGLASVRFRTQATTVSGVAIALRTRANTHCRAIRTSRHPRGSADRPNHYVRWRTDCSLYCAQTGGPRRTQFQRAAIRNHPLEPRFTAQAGVSTNRFDMLDV
jgi:hypothetical protein